MNHDEKQRCENQYKTTACDIKILIFDMLRFRSMLFSNSKNAIEKIEFMNIKRSDWYDACSDATYVTEHMVKALNLKIYPTKINAGGLGDSGIKITSYVHLTVTSMINTFSVNMTALVVKEITKMWSLKDNELARK